MEAKKTGYYDGTRLLSMKDVDGNLPLIYICTSNRTAGKSTYFTRLLLNGWIKRREKFMLLYRWKGELDEDVTEPFFKVVEPLFYPGHRMASKNHKELGYRDLFYDEQHCGYAVAINSSDRLKKSSAKFSDVKRILFDEFMPESNKYCEGEVEHFQSVITTVSRGAGEMVRRVPVYMVSNPVTIINPYYTQMGISARLKSDTRFLRGRGFVLEANFNAAAKEAQEQGILKAFGQSKYSKYSAEGAYLNDNQAFIDHPRGRGQYLATIACDGREYAVRSYREQGIIYCDDRPDHSYPQKLAVTTEDHQINYVMLRSSDLFVSQMRYYFNKGCFRFKDLRCKDAIMKMVSY